MEEESKEGKVLIFCVDVSGSMDTMCEGISRLDSVKEALLDEIKRLKFEKEPIKIGIITFGSYVSLIGDGHKFKEVRLEPKIYNSFEQLVGRVASI
jgi:uncharacterized protein YegL